MDQFAVLKEVYTIVDDCDETNNKVAVSIDDYDPLCSNLPSRTMIPQVSFSYLYRLLFVKLLIISMKKSSNEMKCMLNNIV